MSSPSNPSTLPYGAPISLSEAQAVIAAARSEAQKNDWRVALCVVDSGGHLVAFERADGTSYATAEVSLGKARTAAGFRRATQAFHEMVAAGGEGLRMLAMPGAVPIDGGVPLVARNTVVGAIGVSGVTSAQDGQIARAGAAALG